MIKIKGLTLVVLISIPFFVTSAAPKDGKLCEADLQKLASEMIRQMVGGKVARSSAARPKVNGQEVSAETGLIPILTRPWDDGFTNLVKDEKGFLTAKTIEADIDAGFSATKSKFKMSAENKKYFKWVREQFRLLNRKLGENFAEMEHLSHPAYMALLGREHMFITGPAGGGKSDFVDSILNIPEAYPDGTFKGVTANVQLHQMMTEAQLTGYIDPDGLVHLASSVANHKFLKFDELGKGNAAALTSILSLLNERQIQYGPVVYGSPLSTMLATVNVNLAEFVLGFEEQGMFQTGQPLSDRMIYVSYAANWITDAKKRMATQKHRDFLHDQRLLAAAKNPAAYYEGSQATPELLDSGMPFVDWHFLRNLSAASIYADETLYNAADSIAEGFRQDTDNMVNQWKGKKNETFGTGEEVIGYYPPSILSTRTKFKDVRSIRHSFFIDLLLMPEEALPSDQLIKILENRIELGPYSAWRLAYSYITNAPGRAVLAEQKRVAAKAEEAEAESKESGTKKKTKGNKKKTPKKNSGNAKQELQAKTNRVPPTITWAPLLELLRSSGGGAREVQILQQIEQERMNFKGQLDKTLKDYQDTNETIGSALEKIKGWAGVDASLFEEVNDWEDFIRFKSGDRSK